MKKYVETEELKQQLRTEAALGYVKTLEDVEKIIDFCGASAQPPADQWIPCSERLPENDGKYLCTSYRYQIGTYNFSNDLASIDDYDFPEYEYRNRKGFYVYDSEWGYGEVDSITAWMPLPEPYKGVE